jgi:hypothetical protein
MALLCAAPISAAPPVPPANEPPAEPAPVLAQQVPVGTIVAFMPRAGSEYRGAGGLRGWLARRGWAICDGSGGTPDLRDPMLLGTTDPSRTGERLGARDHAHQVRGETGTPVRRNRSTPTGRQQLRQIPDEQHRHSLRLDTGEADHLPPSTRVLFIMKVR